VNCRWCGESAVGNWLIFDFGRRRRPRGRDILELEFCGVCVEFVGERATPTRRPFRTAVPGRPWPWPARAAHAVS
jgi:hypothetical protein